MGGARRLPSTLAVLREVTAPDGTVYASNGPLFADGQFGRDSLQTGLDLAVLRPDMARAVILASARLQGVRDATPGPGSNEEECGKMYHEHRRRVIAGQTISSSSLAIFELLDARWGGNGRELTYYGTVDATPMYIKLVAAEAVARGERVDGSASILDQTYVGRDNLTHTVRESVAEAALWIERRIQMSPLGLLDFCRTNPDGIEYQNWTDGKTSLLEATGAPGQGVTLDPTRPIATPEVQASAYDALREAARLLASTRPADARRWQELASALQLRTLEAFWMPEHRYMAMAVTTDQAGLVRQVPTVAALGAEMLNSAIFDNLPSTQREQYLDGIVSKIVSRNFVTDAGVRVLSLEHEGMAAYWQYQGVHTSWPKQTFTVIQGLHRHGLHQLARELEVRLLNAINISGEFPEFFYVTGAGSAVFDPVNSRGLPGARIIAGTNFPEPGQTWTGSAVHVIKTWSGNQWHPPDSHNAALEAELLRDFRRDDLIVDTHEMARLRTGSPAFLVDRAKGAQHEAALVVRSRQYHRRANGTSLDREIA